MPKIRTLELSEAQRQELIDVRDHAAEPYLRERCAGLLKVADGLKAADVARRFLLKAHKPDTLYTWLNRYQQQGIQGLKIRFGRGRKPAFSPCEP
ncbi:MAG TPA: helix-turn-helix domain-containing protein [Ktedonobacteraceae bacterium]|nr:helix-turn-helix domain-containing protein [Ktedonobacteraceae bacterium]